MWLHSFASAGPSLAAPAAALCEAGADEAKLAAAAAAARAALAHQGSLASTPGLTDEEWKALFGAPRGLQPDAAHVVQTLIRHSPTAQRQSLRHLTTLIARASDPKRRQASASYSLALAHLCAAPEHRAALIDANVPALLVGALRSRDPDTMLAGATGLAHLTRRPHPWRLSAADMTHAVNAATRAHADPVRTALLALYGNVASERTQREAFLEARGILAVMEAKASNTAAREHRHRLLSRLRPLVVARRARAAQRKAARPVDPRPLLPLGATGSSTNSITSSSTTLTTTPAATTAVAAGGGGVAAAAASSTSSGKAEAVRDDDGDGDGDGDQQGVRVDHAVPESAAPSGESVSEDSSEDATAESSPVSPASATAAPSAGTAPNDAEASEMRVTDDHQVGLNFDEVTLNASDPRVDYACEVCTKSLGSGACVLIDRGGTPWLAHVHCFVCTTCSSPFTRYFWEYSNQPFCKEHFLRAAGYVCCSCDGVIDELLLRAMDKLWHPRCFKCSACGVEFGSSYYRHGDQALCREHYEAAAGALCCKCGKSVVGGVSALERHWHKDCFACAECNTVFGDDPFYAVNDKPYCEEHAAQARDALVDSVSALCSKCGKDIVSGTLISALDQKWHAECFTCNTCHTELANIGFYGHEGVPYCDKHIRGAKGIESPTCGACQEPLSGHVVSALNQKWHASCFVCAECKSPFDGSFYQDKGKPYCHLHVPRE